MSGEQDFARRLDAIESAYEFMLAYAAQGRDTDVGAASSPSIRDMLLSLRDALAGVGAALAGVADDETARALAGSIDTDAGRAGISVAAALACPAISSQLIDNLNASIHLRATLTGLFLADEILRLRTRAH